jgi:hypothetical protein
MRIGGKTLQVDTMETAHCAICRQKVSLDEDHVEINAELVRTRGRNEVDDYVAHQQCWRSMSDGWMDPA